MIELVLTCFSPNVALQLKGGTLLSSWHQHGGLNERCKLFYLVDQGHIKQHMMNCDEKEVAVVEETVWSQTWWHDSSCYLASLDFKSRG